MFAFLRTIRTHGWDIFKHAHGGQGKQRRVGDGCVVAAHVLRDSAPLNHGHRDLAPFLESVANAGYHENTLKLRKYAVQSVVAGSGPPKKVLNTKADILRSGVRRHLILVAVPVMPFA